MDVLGTNQPETGLVTVLGPQDTLIVAPGGPPRGAARNPALVHLASYAEGSRATVESSLRQIVEMVAPGVTVEDFPWHQLRAEHTAAIRARLTGLYAPNTSNKVLSILRGVIKASWRLGYLTAEEKDRALDVKNVRGYREPKGRWLGEAEIVALFDACHRDPTPAGRRDAALLVAMVSTGMRRGEMTVLTLDGYKAAGLQVVGKGNKERTVPLHENAEAALRDWLRERGPQPGPLFCRIFKGGHVAPTRGMTPQAVHLILARRAREGGVTNITPHDIRRTFATGLIDAGWDLSIVQRLMGHANVNTTAQYDRRGDVERREAVGSISVPYQAREE